MRIAGQMPIALLGGLVLALGFFSGKALAQSIIDEVAFVPVYVDDQANGILKFRAEDEGPFWLAIGTHSDNEDRPFETWSGDIGPYSGPDIAIAFAYIKHQQIALEYMAFELYRKDPYAHVAYFRPVLNSDEAAPLSDCRQPSRIGECGK